MSSFRMHGTSMGKTINTETRALREAHPTGKPPEHVCMLLLGESKSQYANMLAVSHIDPRPPGVEVWTCNAGFRIWRHDLLFVMDDLEMEQHKWPDYGLDLSRHNTPIMTSASYPQWPRAVDYPFLKVCTALGLARLDRYFFNSVPYMLAYACALGVESVAIFGADYWHPNQAGREADQSNTEWWLGFLRGRGINVQLSGDTTLMRAREPTRPLYGYRFDPRITMDRSAAAAREGGAPAESPQSPDQLRANRDPIGVGMGEILSSLEMDEPHE